MNQAQAQKAQPDRSQSTTKRRKGKHLGKSEEGHLGVDGKPWRNFSWESLLEWKPDKAERIAWGLYELCVTCAASCEFEDWRHQAKVFLKALHEDLGIKPLGSVDFMFENHFPFDSKARPKLVKVP